jgi:hypothetical protein
MVAGVASPVTVAPWKWAMAAIPGENPSISLNAPGSDARSLLSTGIATTGRAKRFPVTVVSSATVK